MVKKLLIVVGVLAGLVGLYAGCGFYLLPHLAREQLPVFLSELSGQSVQLQDAHFDPFELTADLHGFMLSTTADKPVLSFAKLAVDIDVIESLKQKTLILASVELLKPVVNIERNPKGNFNFEAIKDQFVQAEPESKPETDNSMPLVQISRVSLEQGQIHWQDAVSGQEVSETLDALTVSVTDFTTRPDAEIAVAMGFSFASGGVLDWQGTINLSGLGSKGHFKLDDLKLRKVWSMYLQELMPLEITDGLLTLQADYDFNANDKNEFAVIIDQASLELKQLELTEKNNSDHLIKVPVISAKGVEFDLQTQKIRIASLNSRDADIKAWLQSNGQINYQALFGAEAETTQQQPAAEEQTGTPWQFDLDQVSLNNYQLEFTDKTIPKPTPIVLSGLNLQLTGYRTQDASKLPLKFETRINQNGSLKLDGDLSLTPFSANLALDLKAIKLKTFQTYLDPYLKLDLVDGEINTRGNLQLISSEELGVNYQGDATIENLVTRDKVKNQDFVKWSSLELKQMVLDVPKQDFKFAGVTFNQPYVRFMIKKDGTNNFNDIVVTHATAAKTKPVSEKIAKTDKTPQVVITIGKVEFNNGQSDFADYSLILPFVVKMNDLNGEIDGFISNSDATTKLKLQGKVHDLAPVKISGNYDFNNGDSDIVLKFSHLPLPLITPYMAEFAGYTIEKGQMTLDLKYTIQHGQLSAQNKIFIDQLQLGEKVENPKAVSMPLELGIALLKDSDGKINLDFPITGSLEDPQFSVGSLVTDVFVNLITKAVTSPFKALASLFDSDADLSTVSFAAGGNELTADEHTKLDQIATALAAKPELVLEVKGMAYENQDWPVMRFDAVKEILKKMKSGELRDKGQKILSDYIELSDEEYKRLLAKFYSEVFPANIEYSLLGTPRIKSKPDADFYALAREQLEGIMQPEPQRLNDLAVSRANRIAKYLTEQAGVDRSRIYILATELKPEDQQQGINSLLSLNVAS